MRFRQTSVARLTTLTIVLAAVGVSAAAQTYTDLYNFGSKSGDPSNPEYTGAIVQGRDGNLYATGPNGGASGYGAIFKITPSGTLTVIHSFDGTDGNYPLSGLILGSDGNFYGTTFSQGSYGGGTVFKITPAGALTTLYNFPGSAGTDGTYPYSPPIQGTDGSWYGTTSAGGANSFGTVYKVTPAGVFTTIYSFDDTHGNGPRDPLVQGSDGNFYGTAVYGGAHDYGEVFKITPAGVLTVLHSFDNSDGGYPTGPLIQGSDGNFYGTTEDDGKVGGGTAFKISPAGVFTVLHNMNGATDGAAPYDGVMQASDGNFYGTNGQEGSLGYGTIFKITPNNVFSALHNFSLSSGVVPQAIPFQHTNGILYGDTYQGGTGSVSPCTSEACGVFYSLNVKLPAFVRLLSNSGRVGSKVQMLGQGFSSASVVKFNGVKASTVAVSGTTFLTATVPTGASDGYVTITTGATTLKSSQLFVVHNSWGAGTPIPTAVASPATGVVGGEVYVVGGRNGSTIYNDNQIYNLATKKWITGGATLPASTYTAANAVVNNILYVIGGTTTGTNVIASVWAYNPKTNTWTGKAAMPTARAGAATTVENGLIYVIGGADASFNRLTTVESYNPTTNVWKEEAPLKVGKTFSSVGLVGSTIAAADGVTSSGDTGDNEAYDAATNVWSLLKADPTGRDLACGGSVNGELLIAGGRIYGKGGAAESLNESFTPSKDTWTTLASLPQATQSAGSAVYEGQLYCFGGNATQGGASIANVQIYQP